MAISGMHMSTVRSETTEWKYMLQPIEPGGDSEVEREIGDDNLRSLEQRRGRERQWW